MRARAEADNTRAAAVKAQSELVWEEGLRRLQEDRERSHARELQAHERMSAAHDREVQLHQREVQLYRMVYEAGCRTMQMPHVKAGGMHVTWVLGQHLRPSPSCLLC